MSRPVTESLLAMHLRESRKLGSPASMYGVPWRTGDHAFDQVKFRTSLEPRAIVVIEHLFARCKHEDCASSTRLMFRCVAEALDRGDEATNAALTSSTIKFMGLESKVHVYPRSHVGPFAPWLDPFPGPWRDRGEMVGSFDTQTGRPFTGNSFGPAVVGGLTRDPSLPTNVALLNILFNEVPVAPVEEDPFKVRLEPDVRYEFSGPLPERLVSLGLVLENLGDEMTYVDVDCFGERELHFGGMKAEVVSPDEEPQGRKRPSRAERGAERAERVKP